MTLKNTSIEMVKLSVKILVCTVLVACAIFLAKYGYSFGKKLFGDQGYKKSPGNDITVSIPEKCGKKQAAEILYESRVVGDETIFYVQELLYEEDGSYVAGDYVINNSLSGEEIIKMLYDGPETEDQE